MLPPAERGPSVRAERRVVECVPEAYMSARNGEKARAAIERRNRTARRVKLRAAQARASQPATESGTQKARKS